MWENENERDDKKRCSQWTTKYAVYMFSPKTKILFYNLKLKESGEKQNYFFSIYIFDCVNKFEFGHEVLVHAHSTRRKNIQRRKIPLFLSAFIRFVPWTSALSRYERQKMYGTRHSLAFIFVKILFQFHSILILTLFSYRAKWNNISADTSAPCHNECRFCFCCKSYMKSMHWARKKKEIKNIFWMRAQKIRSRVQKLIKNS